MSTTIPQTLGKMQPQLHDATANPACTGHCTQQMIRAEPGSRAVEPIKNGPYMGSAACQCVQLQGKAFRLVHVALQASKPTHVWHPTATLQLLTQSNTSNTNAI